MYIAGNQNNDSTQHARTAVSTTAVIHLLPRRQSVTKISRDYSEFEEQPSAVSDVINQ